MEWLYGAVGLILGTALVIGYSLLVKRDARTQAKNILDSADRDAEARIKESQLKIKESELESKASVEHESNLVREKQLDREREIDKRETAVNQRSDDIQKQERIIESMQTRLKVKLENTVQREKDLNDIFDRQRKQLHQITGLSKEQATKRLLKLLETELEDEVGARILKHERRVQELCEDKSRDILLATTQRFAAAHTADSTTSSIDIPNDEMKGRIIGREGRNIRSFEKETGIDVIIDDTPGVVIVSGFDPVRREVARISLEKLMFVATVRDGFDYVLFDSPPVFGTSDSLIVAGEVDHTLLVVRLSRKNVRHLARRAKDELNRHGARVLGIVTNGELKESPTKDYYYQPSTLRVVASAGNPSKRDAETKLRHAK